MMNAVVTLCIGDVPYFKYSEPLMRKYADKIGADFIIISETTLPVQHNIKEKWQVYNVLANHDRVLYVDADVLINPNSPNIFDEVPIGKIGVVDTVPGPDPKYDKERADIQSDNKCIHWVEGMTNAGVIVIDKENRDIMRKAAYNDFKYRGKFQDNTIFNYLLYMTPEKIHYLDKRWNYVDRFKLDGFTRADKSPEEIYFMHFAGKGFEPSDFARKGSDNRNGSDNRIRNRTEQMKYFSELYDGNK